MTARSRRAGPDRSARRRARELATQVLCSLDIWPDQDVGVALDLFLGEGGMAAEEPEAARARCRELVEGAWAARAELDGLLLRIVTGWRPERMLSSDRAALRLALYEGFIRRDLPIKASISEAMAVAERFGEDGSARFVNGVLARAVRHMFPEGTGEEAPEAR